MKRICIVGSKGQLGAALLGEATKRGLKTLSAARQPGADVVVDLERTATFESIFAWQPDTIFLAAGYTYVDKAESEPERAAIINAQAPEYIAQWAASRGAKVVYYSTDYIFDGTQSEAYKEEAKPNPESVYGKTKLLGEQAVLEASSRNLILRSSVVYGPDAAEKNFVYQCIKASKEGRKLKIANDQRANPTYSAELAWASFELLEKKQYGIFNAVGPDGLTRPEFGAKVCKTFDLDAEALFAAYESSAMKSPAKRPLNGSLDDTKLQAALGRPLLDAGSGLTAFAKWMATNSSKS